MLDFVLKSPLAAAFAGFLMMFLATNQHVNSAKDRYIRAIPTSLCISMVAYLHINYAVIGNIQYVLFSIGAAIGSALGIYLGNRS